MSGISEHGITVASKDAFPPSGGVRYILAAGPRSGSTLLCKGLASTKIAGIPEEYFFRSVLTPDCDYTADVPSKNKSEYLAALFQVKSTDNNVFGLKMFWDQWDLCIEILSITTGLPACAPLQPRMPNLLSAWLGGELKYIWLRRNNIVAQGISFYRAAKTQVWEIFKGQSHGKEQLDNGLRYDFDSIDGYVRQCENEDSNWDKYFKLHGIEPLVVTYEDFIARYEPTIRETLKFLDLPHETVGIAPPAFERQADARSLDWEARYRETARRRGASAGSGLQSI